MARHNNVKIYNAFFRKIYVLFAAIPVSIRQFYLVNIMQQEVGQLWIMLKKYVIFIAMHITFFKKNTW